MTRCRVDDLGKARDYIGKKKCIADEASLETKTKSKQMCPDLIDTNGIVLYF